jgi:hypothetical protein
MFRNMELLDCPQKVGVLLDGAEFMQEGHVSNIIFILSSKDGIEDNNQGFVIELGKGTILKCVLGMF